MIFRKIEGPIRIDSNSDGGIAYLTIPARPGGRASKTYQHMVKVLRTSDTTNTRITAELHHGCDAATTVLHSTTINAQNPGSVFPSLLVGDGGTTPAIGEWLGTRIGIAHLSQGAAVWAMVEVYEMRKPF